MRMSIAVVYFYIAIIIIVSIKYNFLLIFVLVPMYVVRVANAGPMVCRGHDSGCVKVITFLSKYTTDCSTMRLTIT